MKNFSLILILVACALGAVACYTPALRTNNPLVGDRGIRVTVRGQDCDATGSDGELGGQRSIGLKLRIENPSPEPLRFDPHGAVLREEGRAIPPMNGSAPIVIAAGQEQDVLLRYFHQQDCTTDFDVGFDGAFQLGGHEARLADLRLRPY